jgi:hypothetical protein
LWAGRWIGQFDVWQATVDGVIRMVRVGNDAHRVQLVLTQSGNQRGPIHWRVNGAGINDDGLVLKEGASVFHALRQSG